MPLIYVLGGGLSDEREVSLRSSSEVLKSVQSLGYNCLFVDPKQSEEYLNASSSDIVLPVLHGKYGEDGQLQKTLEERHIPFLGADSISSAKCFDKWETRKALVGQSVSMPKGELVNAETYSQNDLANGPHVLKVLDGGSSIGTYIVRKPRADTFSSTTAFSEGKNLLIEELIKGSEITVPVLGDIALPVIEIVPPTDGEFDYDNKYNGKTQELCPPKTVPLDLQEEAKKLALNVHQIMKCRHFSRVDIMIDRSQKLYVLEINTIPGLTAQSLFPKSALEAGMSMEQLVQSLLQIVATDYSLSLESFKV